MNAQDLIVTNFNDSLNVKITSSNKDRVFYTSPEGIEYEINSDEVQSMVFNFYINDPLIPAIPQDSLLPDFNRPHSMSLRLYGGWSKRLSNTLSIDGLGDYYNDLKSGYHLGAEISFFFNETQALGLLIDKFQASNGPMTISFVEPDGTISMAEIEDEVIIDYYALSYTIRVEDNKNIGRLIINFGAGYSNWVHTNRITELTTIEGGAIGVHMGMRYEYHLTKNIALNLGVDLLGAKIKSFDVSVENNPSYTISPDEALPENIVRFNLNGGIAFNF